MKISKTLFRAIFSEIEDLCGRVDCISSCTCSSIANPEFYSSIYSGKNVDIEIEYACKYPNGDLSKEPFDKKYYIRPRGNE